jgi:hypothetical protein
MCRLVRRLFFTVLLLAAAPGCQVFYGARPVAVEARDAETSKPIPGVEVKISYPLETAPFAPPESKGATGSDGIARLEAAPFGRAGIMVEVSARGYMSEVKYLSIQEVQAIERAHWFEDVQRRPASLVMELFADPGPSIELVAPAGYRGRIKAHVQVQTDFPAAAGQRAFSYVVPASGEVVVAGPPLFRRVSSANLRVKFADDRPLALRAKETELGYWYLKNEGSVYYFFVGTPRDFDGYYRSQEPGIRDQEAGGRRQKSGARNQKIPATPDP